jgi:hypothetical protein
MIGDICEGPRIGINQTAKWPRPHDGQEMLKEPNVSLQGLATLSSFRANFRLPVSIARVACSRSTTGLRIKIATGLRIKIDVTYNLLKRFTQYFQACIFKLTG